MRLTEEQQVEVMSKIGQHFLGRSCSVCHKNDWKVDAVLYEVREFTVINVGFASETLLPVVVVTCANCGNLLFFNAMRLGVVGQST